MKKLIYISIICTIIFGTVSCDDYLDVNINPDAPATVTADLIMPVVMFYAAQSNFDHAEYSVYLSQALTTGARTQANSYGYRGGWHFLGMNRHPQWRRHFYDIGKNIEELRKAAEVADQYDYIILSRTIMLMSTQLTTDVFGDMPRKEAYQTGSPTYDSQESIYEWMLEEIEDLLKEYDSDRIYNVFNPITVKQDRVFAGDMKKWKQVVYALKARILLRNIPVMNNNKAMCEEIIKAAESALANWTEPLYRYEESSVQEKNNPWSNVRPLINGWESRQNDLATSMPSKFFMEYMLRYESANDTAQYEENFKTEFNRDPRLPYLMEKQAKSGKYEYRYLENNYGMDASMTQNDFPDLYANTLAKADGTISLFSTEELYFIIAEAAYWADLKQKSLDAMKEGIRLHMRKLAVEEQQIERYLNSTEVPGTSNITLADIMREKYIAMYLQAEQWNDMRRYNYSNNDQKRFGLPGEEVIVYPTLRRPYNLYVAYWDVNDPNQWIQRINYDPQTEYLYSINELTRLGAYDPVTNSGNPDWLRKPMIWSPLYTN